MVSITNKLTVNDLYLPSLLPSSSIKNNNNNNNNKNDNNNKSLLLLSLDHEGKVQTLNPQDNDINQASLTVNSMQIKNAIIDNELQVSSIILKSLTSNTNTNTATATATATAGHQTLLTIDTNGKIQTANDNIDSIIKTNHIHLQSIKASEYIHASSILLEDVVSKSVLGTDENGKIIEMKDITNVNSISTQSLTANSIQLSKSNYIPNNIITIDSTGSVFNLL